MKAIPSRKQIPYDISKQVTENLTIGREKIKTSKAKLYSSSSQQNVQHYEILSQWTSFDIGGAFHHHNNNNSNK